jgi:hypothetical protein
MVRICHICGIARTDTRGPAGQVNVDKSDVVRFIVDGREAIDVIWHQTVHRG